MRKLKIKPKYRKQLILCISILCVVVFSVFLFSNNKTDEEIIYHVGIVENDKLEKQSLMNAYEAYLKNRNIEIPNIEYVYYPTTNNLIEAMNRGLVDISFLDAYAIAKADIDESLTVIASKNITVESEEPQNYYRTILLRKENIEEADELIRRNTNYEEMTYCVMNPTSVAGFIGVMPFFEEYDFSFYDVNSIKVENFEESLIYLAANKCDVGIGYTNIREEYEDMWEYYSGSKGSIYDELSIIYVSEKLYDDAVIISNKIDDTFKKRFLELLYKNKYSDSSNENYDYLKNIIKKYLGGE